MIPDFETIMLPFLKTITDGKEHYMRNVEESLALHFNLTKDELMELQPSGIDYIFKNRVGWARTYMKKAGLIDSPKRSYIILTQRGKDVIFSGIEKLNVKYLKQFPEFVKFQTPIKKEISSIKIDEIIDDNNTQNPEELIELGYSKIRQALEFEVLEKLKTVDPYFFERIVVELLVKMGYGGSIADAGKAIGRSGDEGIDGIIKEDKLGLDVIYIQAKRWQGVVGRPEVQKFVGALAGQRAKKGVFITTSYFTKEAIEYANQMDTKVVLIDGEKLAQYMIDFNLGVSVQNTYEIKKIDTDYFEEE
ncbi:MAG: restriction endonuclease [Ferruginibacter sp.]|nr:restriction endonuclease [Ferruginibacter sp.]